MPRSEPITSQEHALRTVAERARRRAYAPYSGFAVGAALGTTTGEIVPGCNVENASLGLGICAERAALFAALSRGLAPGDCLVIVTPSAVPTPPCGACREALRQLAPRTSIVSIGRQGALRRWRSSELLPRAGEAAVLPTPLPTEIIAHKRDGKALNAEQITRFVGGLVSGEIEDYQATAFMMAVLWRGMSTGEIRDLTAAMVASGTRLSTGEGAPCIDKHSTGGVGDKISLPLLPMALAAGLRVPMISGRGLGHTGGTLDKLETIPGYRTALPIEDLQVLLRAEGGFIAGQTAELAPADRILYALRDVSATVDSVPLIVSSILSKKLAAGLDGLVLDVKFGRGAFMERFDAAEHLARVLVRVGRELGLPTLALLTRMDAPIGRSVGNALEMREALAFLGAGTPPEDLSELVGGLGGLMLALAARAPHMAAGAQRIEQLRRSGAGRLAAQHWIRAQGGDPRVVDDPSLLAVSAQTHLVRAERAGFVERIDARRAGEICLQLGGGRRRIDSVVDGSVGLEFHCHVGSQVARGDPLATLHLSDASSASLPVLDDLVQIGPRAPTRRPRIAALVTPRSTHRDPWRVPIDPILREST
ncbi:MAG: thymidine phosphorylase [Candidatus Eisenbacteria bacterium]|nr:thymidine phosphorylase [Candidatus Eisenbacteria bacterium]